MVQAELIYLLIGMAGLWIGSDIVVGHGEKIAKALKISTRIIGLTIASIGSSLGEIMTNIIAGYSRSKGVDTSGLAFGTIIGSNISLITFTLGFCGLFTVYYLERKKKSMRRDWIMLLVALLLVFLFSLDTVISVFEGLLLILVYLFYILILFKQEQVFEKVADTNNNKKSKPKMILSFLLTMIGIAIVIYSANLVIGNGIAMARLFNINTTFLGILVGFSTTLPELSISLYAIYKGSHGISIGNIIGGNIIDPLLSLGIGAFIFPINVERTSLLFDLPFLFFSTALALVFFKRGGKLDKLEASTLIGVYFIFLILKFFVI